MQIEDILETCLYVDDLTAAAEFYSTLLGREPFSRVENRHIFFRIGNRMLLLFNPDETLKPSGDMPAHGAYGAGHVAFAIAPGDVAPWRQQLGRLNIAVEAEVTWPSGGQSIYFRDPAGNSVELATAQVWTG